MIYLTTERLTLRPLQQADRQNLIQLDSDPAVMRFLTNGQPTTAEQIDRQLPRVLQLNQKHHHQFGFYAAEENQGGEFIGWFHFRPDKKQPENTRRIELGYRLIRAFWNRGLATEGSLALIKKGFQQLDVECIFAQTMKSNLASQRVMQKCGLSFSHEFHDPNFPQSNQLDVEYQITREQFFQSAVSR